MVRARKQEDVTVSNDPVSAEDTEVKSESEEVAERSQDVEVKATNVHEKVFVLGPGHDLDEDQHKANIKEMRRQLMNQGMRPLADGEFVGEEKHRDGVSRVLTYKVEVEPARVNEDNTIGVQPGEVNAPADNN